MHRLVGNAEVGFGVHTVPAGQLAVAKNVRATQARVFVDQVATGMAAVPSGMQVPPLGTGAAALMSRVTAPRHIDRSSRVRQESGVRTAAVHSGFTEEAQLALFEKEIFGALHSTPCAGAHEHPQVAGGAFRP
jgi:hypothetical protein